MKKSLYIIYLLAFAALISSCQQKLQDLIDENPYSQGTRKLNINLVYPEGFEHEMDGAEIKVLNPSNGIEYKLYSNDLGKASIDLQYGFYRVSVTDKGSPISGAIPIFNRSIDQVRLIDTLKGDLNLNVELALSYAGQLIIKEVYYRGCTGLDLKTFQYDKYITFYNNSNEVAYLDSVCFGIVEPYNAPTNPTPWSYINSEGQSVIRDTIPIIEAIWQFPGTGKSHPLQPGKEVVVALSAAVDHTILRPMSVNLNVPGYWVCYNQRYTNVSYHSSPGPNRANRWLDLLWKQGTSTAYPFSTVSPAPVIFRIPEVGAQAYINNPANRSRKPGTTSATEYVMIPSSWVLDGVECFDVTTRNKRFPASIDATFVVMMDADRYLGKTIHRNIDVEATQKAGGRIVYMDTNNSANDFYVRSSQSIKE